MGLFTSNLPMCPADQHCSQCAKTYMNYCLCTKRDWISLILGIVSVISWGVAEVPQIITNYKENSSEGLALGFLFTWILGDLLNVLGCLLEPATLPTQYYTAVLYLATTLVLATQATYYGYISHKTSKRQLHKIEPVDKTIKGSQEELTVPVLSKFTPSVQIPSPDNNSTPEKVYYSSARSLSRSHTPTVSFFHSRTNANKYDEDTVQESLLGERVSGQSPPASETKTMLCMVFTVTMFLCTYNLKLERNSYLNLDSVKSHNGVVMQVGRRLLQVSGSLLEGNNGTESLGIGTYLGWGMAAIYMGGRLPQIFLNIRRGNVQGLNPLMFVFALIGNSTYVASILVSSMEWSKIQPNLPWVVESSGCVMLDTFILIQFIYFRGKKFNHLETKQGDLDP
ncbi:vacuolar histidine transporter YPQ3-like [Bidens hawaiensis]|uniref:vacuolar histidine transporter YPQ3-like n=1 Tax=Bidens hawaiensis TaxID=980011 RepID=UPI00404B2B82